MGTRLNSPRYVLPSLDSTAPRDTKVWLIDDEFPSRVESDASVDRRVPARFSEEAGVALPAKGCTLRVNGAERAFTITTTKIAGEAPVPLRVLTPEAPFVANDRVEAACDSGIATRFTIQDATTDPSALKRPEAGAPVVDPGESAAGCACGAPVTVEFPIRSQGLTFAIDVDKLSQVRTPAGTLNLSNAADLELRAFSVTDSMLITSPGAGANTVAVFNVDTAGNVSVADTVSFSAPADKGTDCSAAGGSVWLGFGGLHVLALLRARKRKRGHAAH
jgi:uncharacterized protein (TIGR03382 family)